MKTFKHIVLLVIALATASGLSAQKDSDVLFTVAGEPVTVGEFRYIYTKTNGDQADFSKASVMEYLDLYQRFKLKVARARAMGLDTVQALQKELAGYRRQLADNYLEDKQITSQLVETLYARQQSDVAFSHILFRFKKPSQEDRAGTKARAAKAMEGLTAANFAEQAKALSDDGASKDKGGRIGYVAPPFPKGLHRLEAALYDAPANTVIGPIESAAGYHLLLKHDNRPALGEVEVAHILVRKAKDAKGGDIPAKITEAQAALNEGKSFDAVAKQFSEDKKTARAGGYLGFFGINRYDPNFEKAAFALKEDGAVSPIVETSAGYHLIQRISHRGLQPLSDVRPLLEKKIKADGRFADAQKQMLVDLQDKYEVNIDEAAFGRYAALLVDSTFLSFRWKPETTRENGPLMTFGDGTKIGMETFQEFLKK
ncbi:MAG: peptidylprolyl isomerase, partial [Bacteroidota bacterium]